MSMPFYVSPEQLMKDRADFARKGIGRGRSVVVIQYADGLLFVAENQSQALHKISEIYDRIAFAAVGRYNEFENLRIAGVRLADMRGYSYDRRDVTGRGLANAYAQTLGTIFSSGGEKPYEVELFVAEVGDSAEDDQVYRLTYDGSVADEHGYAVMGGTVEQVNAHLSEHYRPGLDLDSALRLAVEALGSDGTAPRRITGDKLEVAVLDRSRSQPRKFRRIVGNRLVRMFGSSSSGATAVDTAPPDIPPTGEIHDPSDALGDLPDEPAAGRHAAPATEPAGQVDGSDPDPRPDADADAGSSDSAPDPGEPGPGDSDTDG